MFDEISDLARQVLEDILFVENHEVSSRNIAIAAVNRPRSLVEGGWSMFIMLKDGELGSDQTPLELWRNFYKNAGKQETESCLIVVMKRVYRRTQKPISAMGGRLCQREVANGSPKLMNHTMRSGAVKPRSRRSEAGRS